MRRGTETDKGYKLEWLSCPFAAYLPPQSVTASQPSTPAGFDPNRFVTLASGVTPDVTYSPSKKPSVSAACDVVTLPKAGPYDDEFAERAAILEYDGGYARAEAERLARAELTGQRDKSWLQ